MFRSVPALPFRTLAAALALMLCAALPVRADMFGPIAGKVYSTGSKALVIVLHGDSSPTYIIDFAKDVARNNPTSTVVQMARPGYSIKGERSKGSNNGKRDHYTKKNNQLLAQGIQAAAQRFPHQELIVVGHSGGAAQSGTIIGTYPGLIDTAILVSGPFDVARWRTTRGSPWGKSQSPVRYLDKVPRSTKIIAATGTSDSNTIPGLARSYVEKAQARGLNAQLVLIPNATHGFKTLHQPVLAIVNREIRN